MNRVFRMDAPGEIHADDAADNGICCFALYKAFRDDQNIAVPKEAYGATAWDGKVVSSLAFHGNGFGTNDPLNNLSIDRKFTPIFIKVEGTQHLIFREFHDCGLFEKIK